MIRLRHIDDLALREQVRAAIAKRRGMLASEIADWWEMDDADYVDLLNDIRDEANGLTRDDNFDDPRM